MNRIFGENIEQGALDQFASALAQDFTVRGALMPDAHRGYSLPIGGVVATDSFILPSWVGSDIGCGMCAVPTTFEAQEVKKYGQLIYHRIMQAVPVGFRHNPTETPTLLSPNELTPQGRAIFDFKGGFRQLGTLGGGNHFMEIGCESDGALAGLSVRPDGRVWVVVHSGSRGIGHGIAQHYMRLADPEGKARDGHYGFRLGSPEGSDYMQDQAFCLEFALQNRLEIMKRIVQSIMVTVPGVADWHQLINRNHNHAEVSHGMIIHRKGATHAEEGMLGVIPGNMRDGSFIVEGKGNPESLWSSSHGAGRVLGRKAAKRELSASQFTKTMRGVQCGLIDASTLDESPMAYKNIFKVMDEQRDLVKVLHHIRPLINVKG